MELHEELFNVASLLFAAMPGEFPTPDAVRVRLEVTAKSKDARDVLNAPPLESWVVRLLADGMDGDAVLHRLFDKQLLAKQPFDEAKYIAWIVSSNRIGPDAIELDVIGSGYWMDALLETEAYSSNAKSDCVLAE
ncbi:MAG: hypothetical protein O3A00_14990 [Planctomycetota bacterium]|nr:hypothetical protein [Planctomycetota bacterium]